uniref:Uncharacterized protein n=1 Tax=Sus scrofa TaxID=9823 RepID=A0A8D1SPK6_PIG
MNPVYSPVQPGAPYGNPKNMAYTGYPTAYPAAAPAYNPSLYPTSSPSYAPVRKEPPNTCWPFPVLNCSGLSLSTLDSPRSPLWELRQFSLWVGEGLESPPFSWGLRVHLSSAGSLRHASS